VCVLGAKENLLRIAGVLDFNSCRRVDAMAAQVIKQLSSENRTILDEAQLHVFHEFCF
jgi:hypothetical protein